VTVRAVFDCMVFLQGAARPDGPAAACLRLVETGFVQLCFSGEAMAEVRDVLSRPRIRRKFPVLTPETVERFLARVARRALMFQPVPAAFTLRRDPKDEKYLNLAAACGAGYLVTRDNDLLDLMDPRRPEHQSFQVQFPELTILDPVAFLQLPQLQPGTTPDGGPPASEEANPGP